MFDKFLVIAMTYLHSPNRLIDAYQPKNSQETLKEMIQELVEKTVKSPDVEKLISGLVIQPLLRRFLILDASLAFSLVCDHGARDATLFVHARVE